MSSTILLIVLLCAHITGLISELLLNATVGGSVLIPCSLPELRSTLEWFYWQEGDQHFFHWEKRQRKDIQKNKYENRTEIFDSEFSSGNISIRLHNISPEDNNKKFFAFVKSDKQKQIERLCESKLQVSAPYQDLVLTVNDTTNSATCTARGGYPGAQVSWKNDEQLDLQGAETSLQQDPTEKTFSFTSSVNVTGLKSVTCVVYNPHSHETITRNMEIDNAADTPNPTPGVSTPSQKKDGNDRHRFVKIASFVIVLVLAGVLAGVYVRYRRRRPVSDTVLEPLNPQPDVPNPQDQVQEEAPDLNQDAAREPVVPNPQDPVQEEAPAQDQDQDQAQDQDQDQAEDQDQDPPNQQVVPNLQDRTQPEEPHITACEGCNTLLVNVL